MSKEAEVNQRWVLSQLSRSNAPFSAETLDQFGEVEGVIHKVNGALVLSKKAMEFLLQSIAFGRKRLRVVTKNPEKPDTSSGKHGKTQ